MHHGACETCTNISVIAMLLEAATKMIGSTATTVQGFIRLCFSLPQCRLLED